MRSTSHAGAVLTIDLDAIARNYRHLAELSPGAACAAVVKADAYGLGAERVAPVLARAGCRAFFVATLDEGLDVRRVVDEAEIFVLNGLPPGAAPEFARHRLSPVLNQLGEVDSWGAFLRRAAAPALAARPRAALHVDTGMNRLGLPQRELDELAQRPRRLDGIELALVMSHLACAEDPAHAMNGEQRARFDAARAALPPARASLANSSGIFLGREFHYDLVRAGVALYGVNPTLENANPMAEVVSLQGKILQVRDVDRPMTVGYGAAHRVTGPGRLATVGIGYADGYLRAFSGRGWGVLAGTRVPVVGRVSMDMITLDVTAVPPAEAVPGTPVALLGGGVPVDEAAACAGTIPYELLTALGRRYQRLYRGGEQAP